MHKKDLILTNSFFVADSESVIRFSRSPLVFSYKNNVLDRKIRNKRIRTSDLFKNNQIKGMYLYVQTA